MKSTLCLAALAAIASPALAGKIAVPEADPVVVRPFEPAPVAAEYDWNGFYLGARATAGRGEDEVGVHNPSDELYTSDTLDTSGISYGLSAGYRREAELGSRSGVFGLELSLEGGSYDADFVDTSNNADLVAEAEVSPKFAVRLKSGLLSANRRTLFFGTIGYHKSELDYKVEGTAPTGTIAVNKDGEDLDGFSGGLGIEHRLTEALSVYGQGEYIAYDSEKVTDAAGMYTKETQDHQAYSIGVNYQF